MFTVNRLQNIKYISKIFNINRSLNGRIFLKFAGLNHVYDDFWSRDYYYPREEVPDIINQDMPIEMFKQIKNKYLDEYVELINEFLLRNNFEKQESIDIARNVKKY